jgi:hypothetical protein
VTEGVRRGGLCEEMILELAMEDASEAGGIELVDTGPSSVNVQPGRALSVLCVLILDLELCPASDSLPPPTLETDSVLPAPLVLVALGTDLVNRSSSPLAGEVAARPCPPADVSRRRTPELTALGVVLRKVR